MKFSSSSNHHEDLSKIIELQQEVATSGLSLPDLKMLICERTQELTQATGAVVEMVEGDEMVYQACTGTLSGSRGLRLKISSSLSGLSVRTREVLYCEDSETDSRVNREACRKVGARAMICVPLWHRQQAVGVLKVVSPKEHAFSERHVEVLRLIAGLLSACIAQAAEANAKEKALASLKESELKAREATKVKSDFLANISHEIRTPINGIMGMTNLLLDMQLEGETRNYIEIIKRSADSLLSLVNDVLDFSKLEANKMTLEIIDCSVREVVIDIIQILQHLADQKGLRLQIALPMDLSPLYRGDPTRLRQILLNLVNNAIKFTKTGSVSVRVQETKKKNSSLVKFEVTDTGIGIPQDALSSMFNPFTQVDASTTRRFGGTGLGLSICKQFIELMRGQIGVTSVVGVGSTFWFQVELPHSQNVSAVESKQVASLMGVKPERMRILIVEDNSVNQIIARKLVEKMGHSTNMVANGLEALDAVALAPYDLILMDCQMPEMDGYEATKKIRLSNDPKIRDLPIIAMTANALSGDREKCLQAGMNDYVAKPIQPDALFETIQRVIQSKSVTKVSG